MAAKHNLAVKDPVERYCLDVIEARIRASRKIIKACKRHLFDLERQSDPSFPYYYDPEAAERPVRFARKLRHWEGDWSGKLFQPMPWQVFILGSIFGWKKKNNGKRRFRYAYIEIPRKNGKSFLASVVALYMLVADGEEGAQVYATATKKEQAKIVWDAACKIAEKSGLMGRHTSLHWLSLRHPKSNSKFEPLSADSTKLDGLNPHCAICDELHEWDDRALWDVIEDAFGARSQPLMFVITTAGHNQLGICFQQRTHAISILDGVEKQTYVDDTYFTFIADVNEEDQKNWKEPRVWWMANPCLGEAKSLEYMEDQCNKAQLMPEKENTFKNKQLDIWTEAKERWLDMDLWDKCGGAIDRTLLKRARCFVGLDLSSNTDLTCASFVFPPNKIYKEWTFVPIFFYPEDNLKKRAKHDKVPYQQWAKEGYIILTPGNVVDLAFVRKYMNDIDPEFQIIEVGFDPWKAIEIATGLEQDGFKMVQMRQGHGTLGAPTSELERKVLKRQVRHGGHPILRWMAANTVVIKDSNDNMRPDKEKSQAKIDGIVATIMGIGLAIQGKEGTSIYENRGLTVLG